MSIIINQEAHGWAGRQSLPSLAYKCGYCNNQVGSVSGYKAGNGNQLAAIYICIHCGGPNFINPKSLKMCLPCS